MNARTLIASLLFFLFTCTPTWSAQPDWNLSLQVDLGPDQGQNFGTLFELVDDNGNTIAGAGYVGCYNTQARSDRRALHFFVKPQQEIPFKPRPLPRPSTDSGTYPLRFQRQTLLQRPRWQRPTTPAMGHCSGQMERRRPNPTP